MAGVDDIKWYAVQTKYKCEKYVATHLEKKGVEVYLPLLTTTKQYASRKKTTHKPLINCYVFVRIPSTDFHKVLQTEYVFSFLHIAREKAIVRDEEIAIMKRVVGAEDTAEVRVEGFQVGESVEIISGNLTGLEGVLVEENGKNNFVIALTSLGMELVMTVHTKHLRYKRRLYA